jgi:hypothetical protein
MSQFVLPKSVNYDEVLPTLPPNVQNFTQVVAPSNGSVFTQNQNIYIDIPSRGCIDPQSLYIRYKMTLSAGGTGVTADASKVIGCPVYSPFQKVDTYINSQIVDSVSDFNQVAHVWSNLFLGVSEKYALQSAFGYDDATVGTTSLDELDGRNLPAITANSSISYSVSAPLVCNKLTACEKMIPAFACGAIRLVFTIDSFSNFVYPLTNFSTTAPFSISNFEVAYDMLDFGPDFERDILSKPSLMIKTTGYNNSSVTIPANTNGTNTFVFNQRFASIRSAILAPAGTAPGAVQLNGKFDSVDVTTNGYYSLNIGGQVYPQGGPISLALNRSGALCELRKAVGMLYDWSKSMSINNIEFAYTDNSTTSATQPGKVLIGFDCNKINSSGNAIMNGTSSQNSPINAILQFTAATATAKQLFLTLIYDSVLVIDPRTKMINVTQ